MDKETLKRYLEGQREGNRISLEEARSLSPAERFRRFLDFRDWLESVGGLPATDQDIHFYEQWAELHRRHIERTKAI